MISNEGEFVQFSEVFTCVGVVESYLCDLERMMIRTLKDILEVAKGTADQWEIEKTRDVWLEDYCA
jgi:hypothetical protein